MTPLDPDRALALSYVPASKRASVQALWRLDAALGAVLAGGRDRLIGRIKLAWWRESLERLDTAPAPAEPILEAAAAYVLPAIAGAELAGWETGWAVLLGEDALSAAELDIYAAKRGAALFACTARLLGGRFEALAAGEAWALVDLARHSGEPDASAALGAARLREMPGYWPRPLRPLGMLATLAARDLQRSPGPFEIQGSPARMLRMLRHRVSGR